MQNAPPALLPAPRCQTPHWSKAIWTNVVFCSNPGAVSGPRTSLPAEGLGGSPLPAARRERARRERGSSARAAGKAGAACPRQDGGGRRGRSGDCWRPVKRAGPAARRRGPGRAALGKAGAVSIAAAAGGVAPGNFLVPGLGFAGSLLEGKQWGGGHCGSRRHRARPARPPATGRRRDRPENRICIPLRNTGQ
ncbi:hypothetical protein NN561_015421 [Cricetulus griseus]